MSRIEVEGMHRLQGEVRIQGSKNAVLPIISACVLNEGETVLYNCPKIRDVSSMLEALTIAGAKITWEKNALYINTKTMRSVPFIEKAGSMRSSVMLLGSFLGRFGKATLGYPGGCRIGKRPIDLHEQALGALGAVFCEKENYLEAKLSNKGKSQLSISGTVTASPNYMGTEGESAIKVALLDAEGSAYVLLSEGMDVINSTKVDAFWFVPKYTHYENEQLVEGMGEYRPGYGLYKASKTIKYGSIGR